MLGARELLHGLNKSLGAFSLLRSSSYKSVTGNVQKALASIVGEENHSSSTAVREQHGKDESYHQSLLPDVVVFPTSVEQVQDIAK